MNGSSAAAPRPSGTRRQTSCRGVSMIEVMVAMVILSLGFLYAAQMQVSGMRANQAAYYQAQALLLASDMMDRMRSNPAGVAADAYAGKNTTNALTLPGCETTGCTPAQLASVDLYEWRALLVDVRGDDGFVPLLPAGTDGSPAQGSITKGSDGAYRIAIAWQEPGAQSGSTRVLGQDFTP